MSVSGILLSWPTQNQSITHSFQYRWFLAHWLQCRCPVPGIGTKKPVSTSNTQRRSFHWKGFIFYQPAFHFWHYPIYERLHSLKKKGDSFFLCLSAALISTHTHTHFQPPFCCKPVWNLISRWLYLVNRLTHTLACLIMLCWRFTESTHTTEFTLVQRCQERRTNISLVLWCVAVEDQTGPALCFNTTGQRMNKKSAARSREK